MMSDIDRLSLRKLRCFVTVAEELHFHRAAQRLHMSQPPLTTRIQDMERDLGVELFRRAGNRIELTDGGRMVLKAARETLAHADGVWEAAQRAARGACGHIRVALVNTALFFDSIQHAMRAFQEEHPDVSLELAHIGSGPALEGIRRRKLDVGLLRAFPVPLPLDCEEIVLERDRLMLVMSADDAQAQLRRVPLSMMVDKNFLSLGCKGGTGAYAQVMHLWERSGLKPRLAQEAANGPAIMALVAAGLGYTILPSSFQVIRFERVVWRMIETDDRWTESSLNLVYHKDVLAERVPAAFINCLRRHSSAAKVVRQLRQAHPIGNLLQEPTFARPKYPERPIKLVIPFAQGGLSDVVGRLWANKMKTSLGQVYVENQGGAGGQAGGAAVARANPDGYTILLGSVGTHVPIPSVRGTAPYNPTKDLESIAILLTSALAIVVHPDLPVRTVKELVDYAKANPGKLSYGSTGAGSTSHLAGELFKSLTRTADIANIPYKGAGAMISDVIGGHIPMTISGATGHVLDLHQRGKLIMLAVTTTVRLNAAPDVPTAVESGLPGMIAHNFNGLFAPAGTPKAVIERISQATRMAMADDEFRQKLIASGFEPYPDSSPEAARRFVEEEAGRLTPVIKAIGLKLE
jgi:tripartite-type tricarboxylate transporter receptor subunit TctC/DNA-binding transcriptional LysR family regulator